MKKYCEEFNEMCLIAAGFLLHDKGIDIDTKYLEIDIEHETWHVTDAILGGDLSSGLRDIIPEGCSEEDIQVVLVKPKEKNSTATFFIFVDTTKFVAFASLGNE
jgi:hypothetical protein